MKPGSRIKSNACDTEVVIIKYTAGAIQCGGADMSEAGGGGADLSADFAGGSIMGKRYVDEAGTIELLCTKPGPGVPAVGGTLLRLKDAKALPASD